jgi:ring-1,2-phenylacetyl-CoA epoxidase subunit PaaC
MASPTSEPATRPDLLSVADGCLIASHRLTEWVSSAPTMEEDVAIGNIALDLLGQARGLLSHLGDEDRLAYFRDAAAFRNPVICELPNGDFGHTMLRQLFLDLWLDVVWRDLATSEDDVVRGVAEKAIKENAYHRRHSSSWVVRLGDGTAESAGRMRDALDGLWPYVGELAVDGWYDGVVSVLTAATLPVPEPIAANDPLPHTADLTDLLVDMQSLARAHPGATW